MQKRKLGNSDLKLSPLAYGAFAIGGFLWGGNDQKDSIEAIEASLDHGISTIDTAPIYGFGLSEELVAKVLRKKDRSKIEILTKFGLVWDGSNKGKGVFYFDGEKDGKKCSIYKYAAKENVIKEVEESLKRLQTDYIDLLQIHWPDSSTPISETMQALELLIKQGKIRAAALSNYSLDQVKEARETLNVCSNQVAYSMLNRSIEKDLIPYALENNLGIIAYSPLERGLLSGKYFGEKNLKPQDHRNNYFSKFDLKKIENFLSQITPLAQQKNVTISQLVLRFTTLQPGITLVLAGSRNKKQALENAKAMTIEISKQEMDFIYEKLESLS